MAKNAVIPFSWVDFVEGIKFKKTLLLFKTIYIADLDQTLKIGLGLNMGNDNEGTSGIQSNVSTMEFLIGSGLVRNYDLSSIYSLSNPDIINLIVEKRRLNTEMTKALISVNQPNNLFTASQLHRQAKDLQLRVNALGLQLLHNEDFFPIVKKFDIPIEGNKKADVLRFLLNEIPEPDENTPWQDIIDFRNDENVNRKYNSLISWINKVSTSSISKNDIKEEYEMLYHEYLHAFKLHKLKFKNSILEIVVTAGIDLITSLVNGHFMPVASNLLKINSTKISLLQEEADLSGKEIAYIYHAKQKFNS